MTQITPTLGSANSGPKVGPVVITEINYHPPDLPGLHGALRNNERDEYIELQNISGSDAPLYDPQYPTNTWRLRDAVDYTFPQGVTIPAGGYVLVVPIDPSDTAVAADFRTRNSVPGTVRLYGPFSGHLDNAQDSVELVRPDVPQLPPAPDAGVVVQHVVEVGDVGQADAVRMQHRFDAARAVLVEGPAQIERVRDRIEHRLGRHVGFGRMQRGR